MPGLTGILRMSNRNVNRDALLTKMCREMMHEDWYSLDKFVDGLIGLARVNLGIFNPETQPIFNEDKTLCIMMYGEIYDYQRLKDDLINKGHKFVVNNDPEFILHLYEEYGREFVKKLNGSFVLTIWNNKKHELLIANDRYGLRPLYYANHNGYLLFSSEIITILRDGSFVRTINENAVSDFLLFRCILGTKTFLQGINLLPAASIMICDTNKISIENYWDFNFRECKERSEEYYIQELTKLVQKAIERQLKGNHRIGVSLSGGFDTRMIVANIVKKLPSIHTYTSGGPHCKDVRFASKIAKMLGTHHHLFEYEPQDLILASKKKTYLLEGLIDTDSFGIMNRLEEIKIFLDVEISGIGGGEIHRGNCITKNMEISKNEEELFKAICAYLAFKVPDELLDKDFRENREASINCLKSLFYKYNDKPLLNKSDHFFIRETLPSYTRSHFIIKNNQFEFRAPYFDLDLVDFIQTVPISLRKNSYIMSKVFLRLSPKLAKFSFEASGCPVYISQFQEKVCKIRNRFTKVAKRLSGQDLANYRLVDYGRWLQENQEVQKHVKEILLTQKTKQIPHLKREAIQRILEEQFTDKKDNWNLINRLLVLELWRWIFLEDN